MAQQCGALLHSQVVQVSQATESRRQRASELIARQVPAPWRWSASEHVNRETTAGAQGVGHVFKRSWAAIRRREAHEQNIVEPLELIMLLVMVVAVGVAVVIWTE